MGIVDEFKWIRFYTQHHNPFDFTMPRWVNVHPIFLVVTRGIFAVYCIALMTMSILVGSESITEKKSPSWLLFATSWNYMSVTLYFVLAFGLSLTQIYLDYRDRKRTIPPESIPINSPNGHARNLNDADDNDDDHNKSKSHNVKLPWHLKIFWIIFNIAINICTLIVIGYWGLVHDYKKKIEFKFVTYLLIDRHGINFVLMLIDFFLHKIPIRFFHFIYPVVIALAYTIFNIVHWVLTEKNLYDFVDWSNDTIKTVACAVGLLVLIISVQLIWYWIHRAKESCAKKASKSYSVETHNTIPMA